MFFVLWNSFVNISNASENLSSNSSLSLAVFGSYKLGKFFTRSLVLIIISLIFGIVSLILYKFSHNSSGLVSKVVKSTLLIWNLFLNKNFISSFLLKSIFSDLELLLKYFLNIYRK